MTFLNIFISAIFALLFIIVFYKLNRPIKDDPRMSRGLQLLQNKIAVLEDLSDRTDSQMSQVQKIMDAKIREVQVKIELADRQIQMIQQSMKKSMEVAKMFQDKIPHTEIIDRMKTIRYLQAAKMAHQGANVEEVVSKLQLSESEAEMICKVNEETPCFQESELPDWAKDGLKEFERSDMENETEVSNREKGDLGILNSLNRLQRDIQQLDYELNTQFVQSASASVEPEQFVAQSLSEARSNFASSCMQVQDESNRRRSFFDF